MTKNSVGKNTLGRQPIVHIHIDIPTDDISPFDSDEEIERVVQATAENVSFPKNARVIAYLGFLPNAIDQMRAITLQGGLYDWE